MFIIFRRYPHARHAYHHKPCPLLVQCSCLCFGLAHRLGLSSSTSSKPRTHHGPCDTVQRLQRCLAVALCTLYLLGAVAKELVRLIVVGLTSFLLAGLSNPLSNRKSPASNRDCIMVELHNIIIRYSINLITIILTMVLGAPFRSFREPFRPRRRELHIYIYIYITT